MPKILNYLFLLLISLFFSQISIGQKTKAAKLGTDNFSLMGEKKELYVRAKIFCNDAQLFEMAKIGLSVDHLAEKTQDYIIGEFSEWEMSQIRKLKLTYEVLIYDLTTYYRERNIASQKNAKGIQSTSSVPAGFNYGSMGGYLTMAEMELELDSLFMQYPTLITQKVSIGNSLEGRPMWMVKISDNPNIDENEPEALFTGVHHAREVITVTELIYLMQYLLENYGTNPDITYLLQNRELYFIPMVNPDGYVYNEITEPLGGGMWRKNRRDNADTTFGVDLNRNYGFEWGYDNMGSSPVMGAPTYRGTSPFSEPETQVMRSFILSRQFKTANNAHSYGNLFLYPWGYEGISCPDDALYMLRAELMTQENFYVYGQSPSVLYAVNGEANDWMYGEQTEKPKIMSSTSETGTQFDGFWPIQSRILPLCEEMLKMLLDNAWFAGEYLLSSASPNFTTSTNNFVLPVSTINYGQEVANNVTLSFISNSQYVVSTGTTYVNNLPSAAIQSYSIPISLSTSTPHNQLITGKLRTTFSDGYFIDSAATFVYTGFPTSVENAVAFSHSFLYPNPSDGKCLVKFENENPQSVYVEIFDLQGKRLKRTPIVSTEIDFGELRGGVYLYRFVTDGEVGALQKLVINTR